MNADECGSKRGWRRRLKPTLHTPPEKYHPIDEEHSRAIAQAYEEMQHAPNDPAVKNSYDAMIRETRDQFDHMLANHPNLKLVADVTALLATGNENLTVITWAVETRRPLDEVVAILTVLDVNAHRVARFPWMVPAAHCAKNGTSS